MQIILRVRLFLYRDMPCNLIFILICWKSTLIRFNRCLTIDGHLLFKVFLCYDDDRRAIRIV